MEVILAYAADPAIRRMASSGGAYKAILAHLLDSGQVAGAVIADTGAPGGFAPRCFVARQSSEILRRETNSVYYPVSPVKPILKASSDVSYAATLLPCHAAWLSRVQSKGRCLHATIKLGLLCNRTPTPGWSLWLMRQMGLLPEEVTSMAYRGAGWPGGVTAETRAGERVTMSWSQAWGHGPGMLSPCARCLRSVPECDLAAGDPWHAPESVGDGKTMIAVLTPAGDRIVSAAVRAGVLLVESCDLRVWQRQVRHMDHEKRIRYSAMANRH